MVRFLPFLLLFFSGMASLSYQMIWMREFRLVFGASTASTAAVSALFMAGLGLGGWLLGPKADKHPRPLRLYGLLELGIAILAGLSPFILQVARIIYLKSGGMMVLGMGGATMARLLLAAMVMGLPAFLMGGTLPAAAKAVTSAGDTKRLNLGVLYGINTLGALTGVFLTTFVVLEALGARDTLTLAVVMNIIVAVIAIGVALPRSEEMVADSPKPDAKTQVKAARLSVPMVLFSAALVGFVFFLMELVWYRMLAPVLGGSIYTFGLILATALAGIGLGGALHPVLFKDREPNAWHLAVTCLLEGLAIMVPFAVGDLVPVVATQLRSLSSLGFTGLAGSWLVITFFVVFPAAVISGVQFPLLISLLGKGTENIGRQTGLAYACNTGGAILGSLAGGFGLMPKLTAPGCWMLSGLLLAILGVVIVVSITFGKDRPPAHRQRSYLPVGLTAVILAGMLACFLAAGPSAVWRHTPVGAGRILNLQSMDDIRYWMSSVRNGIIWEADGVESSVAIGSENGYTFIVNGKADGNVIYDRGTQIMVGTIGALLHPNPQSSLVVGLGTGCTAGWLSEVPTMEQVDVVELESAILHMAELSALANHDVVAKHKSGDGVRIIINDAREVLNTIPSSYDLIVSEPSNPYRAGIASLFTREFYQEVANRLNKGGLFLSWCQAYEIETESVLTILATLKAVFPYVECWTTQYGSDLLFVSSMEPIRPEVTALESKLQSYPFKEAVFYSWGVDKIEGFVSHHLASSMMVNELAGIVNIANINTDDLTPVEYAYANSVGRTTSFSMSELLDVSQADNQSIPAWFRDRLDPSKQRLNLIASQMSYLGEAAKSVPGAADQAVTARLLALMAWTNGNVNPMLELLNAGAVLDLPLEKLALAESLATIGDERALDFLAELGDERWPVGSSYIKAVLAEKQNKPEVAAKELNAAFESYRKLPWEVTVLLGRFMRTTLDFSKQNSEYAPQMYEAMKEPFALSSLEESRIYALLDLANMIGHDKVAETLTRWIEPNPKWNKAVLLSRVKAYQATNNPLLSKAVADYQLLSDSSGLTINDYLRQHRASRKMTTYKSRPENQ